MGEDLEPVPSKDGRSIDLPDLFDRASSGNAGLPGLILEGMDDALAVVSGVLGRSSDREDWGSNRAGEGMGTGGIDPGIGCKRSRLAEGLSAMFSLLGRLRRFCSIEGRRPRPG